MPASAPATVRLFGSLLVLAAAAAPLHGQVDSTRPTVLANGKKALTVADYSKWRNIEDAAISPDGRWVTWTLRFANTLPQDGKPVLHLKNLDTDQEVTIANAHDGTFSPDSRWLVYQVDSVPAPRGGRGRGSAPATDTAGAPTAQGAAGRANGPPSQPPKVELRELASGRTQSWQRMQSASFNMPATHLLLQRRAAPGGEGRDELQVLVGLAGSGFGVRVVEAEAVDLQQQGPERRQVRGRQLLPLGLEIPRDRQQVALEHRVFVEDAQVRRRQLPHEQRRIGREEGVGGWARPLWLGRFSLVIAAAQEPDLELHAGVRNPVQLARQGPERTLRERSPGHPGGALREAVSHRADSNEAPPETHVLQGLATE